MNGSGKIIQATNELFPLGNETEIRLGRIINGSFSAGVPFLQFAKTLQFLKSLSDPVMIHQVDVIKGNRRLSVESSGREVYIQKGRRTTRDFYGSGLPTDVRVCSMTETMIPFSDAVRHEMRTDLDLVREKDRARFLFDHFQIDLTVVNTKASKPVFGDQESPRTTYEIELEIHDRDGIDEAVLWMIKLFQSLGELPFHPAAEFRPV